MSSIQAQTEPSIKLTQYIDSLHWDASKSGPLIAIEADKLWINDNAPRDLTGFEAKMVKAGNLSVIKQSWTIALDDDNLPNAFQSLSDADKMTFLVATLSASDLEKLITTGISADELEGEQRAALLSMIPKPLTYLEGQVSGSRFSSQSQGVTLPEDQYGKVRLLIQRGISIGYDATSDGQHSTGYSTLSSLSFPGLGSVSAVRLANRMFDRHTNSLYKGQVVDSAEKKSQIDWSDERLKKSIDLKAGTIGDTVAEIAQATGVEVYADARITKLTVNAYGNTVSAGDLLRGLALALGGVIRKVGPAYVLTADIEGTATREMRLTARTEINKRQVASLVASWRATAQKRDILDRIRVASNDPLKAGSVPAEDFSKGTGKWNDDWIPLSQLPSEIGSALQQIEQDRKESRARYDRIAPTPLPPDKRVFVPDLAGKVKITPDWGYRFVLPDGRPLDSVPLDLSGPPQSTFTIIDKSRSTLPVEASKLASGSAVAISSDSPETVDSLCQKLKAYGVKEIWLDSSNPQAAKAVVANELQLDLIVHPWNAVSGERCTDPDRTVLGQTGSDLEKTPGAGDWPIGKTVTHFANTYSPLDSNLAGHWERLISAIPRENLNSLILVDWELPGYQNVAHQMGISGAQVVNGVEYLPGLQESLPNMFALGYSTSMRLEFLRKYQIDPVDVHEAMLTLTGPPIPYFDQGFQMGPRAYGAYPNVHFPRLEVMQDRSMPENWDKFRRAALQDQMIPLLKQIGEKSPSLFMQMPLQIGPRGNDWTVIPVDKTQPSIAAPVSSRNAIRVIGMTPANVEIQNGSSGFKAYFDDKTPVCFDLRQVPPAKIGDYLKLLFGKAAQ